ncbi:hypothetical protein [Actinomadura sp. CNU-125]|uniref:hypothetical protein n=1 Tax=Actinomadura sp. CNU-125 TaxID=1904961 RepID=UPI00130162BF|nr:hypothetical protein [Actinomadura sp. CNU-125]
MDELLRLIEDPDDDSTGAYDVVDLIAENTTDETLVPRLTAELQRFLDKGDFYGRDVVGDALAGAAGVAALPALIRAAARDLGDDQDGLSMTIVELVEAGGPRARAFLRESAADDSPAVRETAEWARGFLPKD